MGNDPSMVGNCPAAVALGAETENGWDDGSWGSVWDQDGVTISPGLAGMVSR